ncbi:hypothetical protein [Deinococcus hopiensis]|nr:hypothetical protein [Deinococcus hopiensis]
MPAASLLRCARLRRNWTALALLPLLAAPAGALIVPMGGWTPVNGDANLWTDSLGACVLREERHGQAFPLLKTEAEALTFARRLQTSLSRSLKKSGVGDLVTQPVFRNDTWGVLAAYSQEANGVTYEISQLYLSDSGLLRTVTGSSAQREASPCVNEMREFLRYEVD